MQVKNSSLYTWWRGLGMDTIQTDSGTADSPSTERVDIEVSCQTDSQEKGPDLVQKVASLTGLPEDFAKEELSKILEQTGHSEQDLTLEQLRSALISYLESLGEEFLTDPDVQSEAPH